MRCFFLHFPQHVWSLGSAWHWALAHTWLTDVSGRRTCVRCTFHAWPDAEASHYGNLADLTIAPETHSPPQSNLIVPYCFSCLTIKGAEQEARNVITFSLCFTERARERGRETHHDGRCSSKRVSMKCTNSICSHKSRDWQCKCWMDFLRHSRCELRAFIGGRAYLGKERKKGKRYLKKKKQTEL